MAPTVEATEETGGELRVDASASSAGRPELACPTLEVVPASYAAEEFDREGQNAAPDLSAGAYAIWRSTEGLALYSLRPLIERASDDVSWLDPPEQDLSVVDMDYDFDVDVEYRREGTCGRVTVTNYVEDRTTEVFYALQGSTTALVLFDSLGRPAGALPRAGGLPPLPVEPLRPVPASSIQFDASNSRISTRFGTADLRQVADYGTWYVRPDGVVYLGSERVVVHVCRPKVAYVGESFDLAFEGACGSGSEFNMDNPPPVRIETHFGVRSEAGYVVLEPRPYDSFEGGAQTVRLPLIPAGRN